MHAARRLEEQALGDTALSSSPSLSPFKQTRERRRKAPGRRWDARGARLHPGAPVLLAIVLPGLGSALSRWSPDVLSSSRPPGRGPPRPRLRTSRMVPGHSWGARPARPWLRTSRMVPGRSTLEPSSARSLHRQQPSDPTPLELTHSSPGRLAWPALSPISKRIFRRWLRSSFSGFLVPPSMQPLAAGVGEERKGQWRRAGRVVGSCVGVRPLWTREASLHYCAPRRSPDSTASPRGSASHQARSSVTAVLRLDFSRPQGFPEAKMNSCNFIGVSENPAEHDQNMLGQRRLRGFPNPQGAWSLQHTSHDSGLTDKKPPTLTLPTRALPKGSSAEVSHHKPHTSDLCSPRGTAGDSWQISHSSLQTLGVFLPAPQCRRAVGKTRQTPACTGQEHTQSPRGGQQNSHREFKDRGHELGVQRRRCLEQDLRTGSSGPWPQGQPVEGSLGTPKG